MEDATPLTGMTFIKGEPVALERGKIFVLEFWATWCPPCRSTIPHLTELQHRFGKDGVIFIGITSETAAKVRPFVTSMGDKMDYRVALDDAGSAQAYMDRYSVGGIPHAFLVDHNMKVRWHGHPAEPSFETAIQQAVNDMKAQKKIDVKGKNRDELMRMPIRDLKQVLSEHGISAAGLPEKGDLVAVILDKCV